MATIKDDYKAPLESALADGTPCLLGTVSADGLPEISPKGSLVVYDGDNVGFWERSHRGAARNIDGNARVVIYYRNPEQAEHLPRGAAIRLYGTASKVTDDAVRDKIYDTMPEGERKADADKTGHAVMVHIDRVTNLRGDDV